MSRPGEFEVGQLYNGGKINGLPVYSQPGGQGTPVVPQAPREFPQVFQGYYQVPMTYPSLYQFGCGHYLNCPEVFCVYNPYNEVQEALVCCNQCGYIQQVISPYSSFQNYEITPLITA